MSSSSSYYASMQQYSGGQTLSGSYQAATATGTPGWVQINFSNDRTGTIYFWSSSTGWDSGRSITRFDFITNGSAISTASGYPQTGWWWNAAQPGRGFFIDVQGSRLFLAAMMYESDGTSRWYVATGTLVSGPFGLRPTMTAALEEYGGGPTLAGAYTTPSRTSVPGQITVSFASSATGTLTLPNGSSVALTRFTGF